MRSRTGRRKGGICRRIVIQALGGGFHHHNRLCRLGICNHKAVSDRYTPDEAKGNYCHFTWKLKWHIFNSKFKSSYMIKWNNIFTEDNFVLKLKTHR